MARFSVGSMGGGILVAELQDNSPSQAYPVLEDSQFAMIYICRMSGMMVKTHSFSSMDSCNKFPHFSHPCAG